MMQASKRVVPESVYSVLRHNPFPVTLSCKQQHNYWLADKSTGRL